jgi:tetraacyldisaccharide 4'-kinase
MRTPSWWSQRSATACALSPLALIFYGVATARRSLYERRRLPALRLPVPVVVIGNITAGGTGKTPLARWVATGLQARGRRPGVVVRSYSASATGPARVLAGHDPDVRGDEAVMLASALACPVWSGPARSRTAAAMLDAHPEIDTVVCDDGLQHYRLVRDFEIVVVDAAQGFGNRLPLPAGPLREPVSRVCSVDAIVVNGSGRIDLPPHTAPVFAMALEGERFRNLSEPERSVQADVLQGKRLAAVAGTGNPGRFFAHLRALGLAFESRSFPDHHRYRPADLRFADADAILMTEKDAIKCAAFADPRMWALPVEAMVSDALLDRVLERIAATGRDPGAAKSIES